MYFSEEVQLHDLRPYVPYHYRHNCRDININYQ